MLIKRASFAWLIIIPPLLWLPAYFCGWFGLYPIGFTIELLSSYLSLFLSVFFLFRLFFSLKKRQTLIVQVVLLLICAGEIYIAQERPFSIGFETRLKHEYKNIPEMQNWALAILKTAKRDDYPLDQSAYPAWVFIRNFPKPLIYVDNEEDLGDNGSIEISWGTSMIGDWGLVIGRSTLMIKEYNKWADGVYFYKVR